MQQAHPATAREWWQRACDVVRLQREIWSYHANLRATHTYFSAWWTWPFLYRPTWYFWWSGGGVVRGIIAIGNPAIWWASLPAAGWALVSGVRGRDARRVFVGSGFFLLYLPWGLSPRTLNFSHYLFEAIPYACLALGMLLDHAWNSRRRPLAVGLRHARDRPLLRLPAVPDGDAGRQPALGVPLPPRSAVGSGPGSRAGSERRRSSELYCRGDIGTGAMLLRHVQEAARAGRRARHGMSRARDERHG